MISFIILFLLVVMLLLLPRSNMCTPMLTGGQRHKNFCNNIKVIEEGEDTCWIDTVMYTLIIPDTSYDKIKNKLHKIPELNSYANILRKNRNSYINRCTPNGGYEISLLKKIVKTLGLTISYSYKNRPDYLLRIDEPKVLCPNYDDYELIGMMFRVEFTDRPKMGHVACAVKCGRHSWIYYNNCKDRVEKYDNKKIEYIKKDVLDRLKRCKDAGGKNSCVDEILYIYTLNSKQR